MLNIIGCCCGGPGYTRLITGYDSGGFGTAIWTGGIRPINPADDLNEAGTMTTRWPCWAVAWYQPGILTKYAGQPAGGVLKVTAGESDLAYVAHHMVFNTRTHALINGAVGAYTLDLMKGCELSDSTETGGGLSGGAARNTEVISTATGAAIIDDAYPAGTWTAKIAGFSGANNDRLYGFNYYADGTDEAHFKAWSVDYTGGDYVEEFVLDDGSGTDVPVTMNVVESTIYCTNVNGSTELEIFANGALVATMGGPAGDKNFNAVSHIDEQLLACVGGLGTAILCIVADGEDTDDQQVTFVATEDETPVEYYARSISWDPDKKCPVVVWDSSTYLGGYVTWITKPLTPGNIIEQDGVKIYANWPSVGANDIRAWPVLFGGIGASAVLAPLRWGVVIPGRMPRPLRVVDGVIEQPPPPIPEPTCDGLDDCEDLLLTLSVGGFKNYTETGVSDGGFALGLLTREWFGENLNVATELPYHSGTWDFRIPLVAVDMAGDPITGDYGDPGILIRRDTAEDTVTYPPPDNKKETYAYAIWCRVVCASGEVHIQSYYYDVQDFIGTLSDVFPTFNGTDQFSPGAPDGSNYSGGPVFDYCSTGWMSTQYEYQDLITDNVGGGGKYYTAQGVIGGSPAEVLATELLVLPCQDDAATSDVVATVGSNASIAGNTEDVTGSGPGGSLTKAFDTSLTTIHGNVTFASILEWTPTNERSFAVLLNFSSATPTIQIVWDDSTNYGIGISGTDLIFGYDDDLSFPQLTFDLSGVLATGWHLLVGTINGSGEVSIYWDAALVGAPQTMTAPARVRYQGMADMAGAGVDAYCGIYWWDGLATVAQQEAILTAAGL